MIKKFSLLVLTMILALSLISCSKDKDVAEKNATTQNSSEQTKKITSEKLETPKSEAELASELVLQNTKLVKIFSINQRMNDNYKELGPFYFIRGVDEKGRKTEVWVNKGKIYEIK